MPGRRRKTLYYFMVTTLGVWALSLFGVPMYHSFRGDESNYFRVYLNGEYVGAVDSQETAKEDLIRARRRIAKSSDEMLFIDTKLETQGERVFWGKTDPDSVILDNMVSILSSHEERTMERCYTVRIGEYTVNLQSREDIVDLLEGVLSQYDTENKFVVSLEPDSSREIMVLSPKIVSESEQEKEKERSESELPMAGIEKKLSSVFDAVTPAVGLSFDDYELGLQEISFGEKIEVTEAYMPENQITEESDALDAVTQKVDTVSIYEAKTGDTLASIALANDMTAQELADLNPSLQSAGAVILPGDSITVSTLQPRLSVVYTTQEYSEEEYNADTIYKDNDDWYTNQQEVVQEAVTGRRRIIAEVTYKDGVQQSSKVLREETIREAVPRIIERGTQDPPSFIWPVTSGYISSGFGYRNRPNAAASAYHKGVDIAVSTGTAVRASSGGTVTQAGWVSGYGYVVYIDHGNGLQSRYGHLSRILVSAGEHVSQGDIIARSGNTGNSTGPHLHFEIRKNGTAVSPLTYTSPGSY